MRRLPREFFDRPATEVAPDLLDCVLWHDSTQGLVAVRLVEVEAYEGMSDPASHAFRGRTARNAVMFGPPGHAYVYFTYGMHFCVNLVCQPAGHASAVLIRAGQVVNGIELARARRTAARQGTGGSGPPGGDSGVRQRTEDYDSTTQGGDSGVRRRTENHDSTTPGQFGGPRAVGAVSNGRAWQRNLARGPARLCQALGIDRGLDGADVCGPGSPLGISSLEMTSLVDGGSAASSLRSSGTTASRLEICCGPRVGVTQAAERPWRFWLAGDDYVSIYRPSKPRRLRQKPVAGRSREDGTIYP